jgi:hypothetical protein
MITSISKAGTTRIVMLAHEEGRMEHFLSGRSYDDLIRKMRYSILSVKKEPGPPI